jgi:hypothetical protein
MGSGMLHFFLNKKKNIIFHFISLCFLHLQFVVLWMSRYDATVEAYTPNGYYVSYDSWGNREEV